MGTRITDLPAATIVNPTDVAPIVQSGTTKQAAVSLIKTTSASDLTSGTLNVSRLSDAGVTAGSYGSASAVPQITVDSKGRVTSAVNVPISGSGAGTVTSIGVTSSTLAITNSPITGSGNIGIELSSISTAQLPASGVTPGTYGSANQHPLIAIDSVGRITGATNQTIAITTAQISGLAASATTDTTNASNITSGTLNVNRLATSGVTAGTYGSTAAIPVLTVDALGRLTAASTVALPGGGGGTPTSVGYLRETITTSGTAATGTINFDAITQPTLYYTSNASGNFTLNIRGDGTTTLDSLLTTAQSLTVTFLNTNGATPYGVSALNIDGSARSVKWLSGTGSIPSPNASSIDAWTFTIIKTASNTFTVLGSLSKFF